MREESNETKKAYEWDWDGVGVGVGVGVGGKRKKAISQLFFQSYAQL